MKKIALILGCAVVVIGGVVLASDHTDAPAVKGTVNDITDLYVFAGQDTNNLVFVANTQGLLAPSATGAAQFDPSTMIEFKIDNNGDNVEDLVIQAIDSANTIVFYGLAKPTLTGTRSKLETSARIGSVAVTSYTATSPTVVTTTSGIKLFAGPRDDPFFFDLNQFHKILAGTASGFNNPGTDSFAGTNVMGIVVEVPKTMLNSTGSINVWLTTSTKE
ncbi:MAG TPA: DUF4331 family protein [Puia sp.]|jgi:hypothetical protein|nr:DUF4331 family protein [Puia sp.]